jgi:hypothetical protein
VIMIIAICCRKKIKNLFAFVKTNGWIQVKGDFDENISDRSKRILRTGRC